MKKKRILNIRFLFVVFIGLMLGIVASVLFHFNHSNIVFLCVILMLVVAISIFGLLYGIGLKKNSTKKSSERLVIICSSIGLSVAFALGALIPLPTINKIDSRPDFNGTAVIRGKVSDYVVNGQTYNKFLIDDISVVVGDNALDLDCKVLVYSSNFVDVKLGNIVTFVGKLSKFNFSNSNDRYNVVDGIGYSTFISTDLVIDDGNPSLKDNVKTRVKALLDSNLSSDNADICFAVLFGDKYALSSEIKETFSYAGIYHILAVSGLHVGVLVAALWFLLGKTKINKYVRLVLFSVVVLFYMYLCSFTPSVCRAGIMAIVLALCRTTFVEYDILSSLSIAGILILLVSPLSIFSVSFQLSFLCILSIITLVPTMTKFMNKIKVPKFLSGSLCISIAVNLVTLPIVMNVYTNVSLLGVLANIVVLPIFSLVYMLLFACVILGTIIPAFGACLKLPNFFLHIIKVIADKISMIPFGVFKTFRVGYFVLFALIIAIMCVHFLMVKKYLKLSFVGFFSLLSIVVLVLGFIPKTYSNSTLFAYKQYGSNAIVYCDQKQNVLIGSDVKLNAVRTIAKDLKISKLDVIVAYDLQLNGIDDLNALIDDFDVSTVIVPDDFLLSPIKLHSADVQYLSDIRLLGALTISPVRCDGVTTGVVVQNDGVNYLVPNVNNNTTQNRQIFKDYLWADCLLVDDNSFWNTASGLLNIVVFSDIDGHVVLG